MTGPCRSGGDAYGGARLPTNRRAMGFNLNQSLQNETDALALAQSAEAFYREARNAATDHTLLLFSLEGAGDDV